MAAIVFFVLVAVLTLRGLVSTKARYVRWAMYTSIGSLVGHDVRGPDGARIDIPALLGPGDAWVTDLTVTRALEQLGVPVTGTFVIRYGFEDVVYGVGSDG